MIQKKVKINKKVIAAISILLVFISLITVMSINEVHIQNGDIYTKEHSYRPPPEGVKFYVTCAAITPGCGVCIGGKPLSKGIVKKDMFGRKSCYTPQ